jgi:hypothetical protein
MRNFLIFIFIFLISFFNIADAQSYKINSDGTITNSNANIYDNVDFNEYIEQLYKDIKKYWQPPKEKVSRKAVLLVRILKDGKIDKYDIYEKSGNLYADISAIVALQKLGEYYKPLPKEYKGKSIDVKIVFDRSVHGFELNQQQTIFYNEYKNQKLSQYKNSKAVSAVKLDKDFFVTPKDKFLKSDKFIYLNALKINKFLNDAYLYKYKIDCENKLIGLKKTYQPKADGYELCTPNEFDTQLQSVDLNSDYVKIYNYTCK